MFIRCLIRGRMKLARRSYIKVVTNSVKENLGFIHNCLHCGICISCCSWHIFCSLSCDFLYNLGVYFCFVKLALMVLDTRNTNYSMFLGMKYYQENLIHQHCVYFRKNTILVCVYFLLL